MRTAWRLAAAAVVILGVALWWMLGRQDAGLTVSIAYSAEKGKIENVTLPDGSSVALNAGSTLEALQGFGGKERRVKLCGEAFFQVEHDKSKPFIVEADGASVRVVGTAFNVSAYSESGSVTTTVAEGKVEFSSGKKEKALLTHGMQGRLEKTPPNRWM
jgi:ferric-dicitrate binding protein FerR (iron transport regulator)